GRVRPDGDGVLADVAVVPVAAHHRVVGAGRHRLRQLGAEVAAVDGVGVRRGDEVAGGVEQADGGVEVGADGRGIDVDGEAAPRVHAEHVAVGRLFDDARRAPAGAVEGHGGGGGEGIAVVVGAVAEAVVRAGEDGHVVLPLAVVVRAGPPDAAGGVGGI